MMWMNGSCMIVLKDPNEMNNVYNDPSYKDVVVKLTNGANRYES